MDRNLNRKTEAERIAYLNHLDKKIRECGEDALEALAELSGIAMGGHEHARELSNKIDEDVKNKELFLPSGYPGEDTGHFKPSETGTMQPPEHQIY